MSGDSNLHVVEEATPPAAQNKMAPADISISKEIKDLLVDIDKRFTADLNSVKETLGKLKISDEAVADIDRRVSAIEDWVEYQEMRSRKYNLLIYGVPVASDANHPVNSLRTNSENTFKVVNNFLLNTMNIEESIVDSIIIANTHRLHPRGDAPPPIIVKCVCMNSRDLVMRSVGGIPQGSRVSIKSDLPVRLKEKRHKLAQVGATMKKENKNIKTRMRESKDN